MHFTTSDIETKNRPKSSFCNTMGCNKSLTRLHWVILDGIWITQQKESFSWPKAPHNI